MKKLLFAVFAAASLIFVSCGKKAADEYNCYNNYEDTAKAAVKNNQNILVILSQEGDDEYSTEFLNVTVKAEGFVNEVSSKYAVYRMDFGQSSYEKTVEKEEYSESQKKEARKYAELMQKNAEFASKLNAQYAPSVYLLTKEGYFISQVDLFDEISDLNAFVTLLNNYKDKEDSVREMVQAVNSAKGLEKVAAIDALFESTNGLYRTMLSDLVKQVLEIDKNNESGLLSKYLLAAAEEKSLTAYLSNDPLTAVREWITVCDNSYLLPEHRQQAYYMAAYILNSSGSTDLDTVILYLKKAIEAYPESENIAAIQNVLEFVESQAASVSTEQE